MARLNGLVTTSGRGVYWQLIDVGGPDVLTIAVSNQTPASLKELLRRAPVPGFWPPEGNEYGLWTIDLDVMREHANKAMNVSGFPPWVSGKVSLQPSVEEGVVRFDITSEMLAWASRRIHKSA
jgi:hypothetical protein